MAKKKTTEEIVSTVTYSSKAVIAAISVGLTTLIENNLISIAINEAAKALKQRDFILIDNAIIGLDNIQNIITYTLLDTNFISNYYNGIIINQRALSSFIKSLSIESDFEFDSNNTIRTISGVELVIGYDLSIATLASNRFKYITLLDNNIKPSIPETEIADIMVKVQAMKSSDGAIGVNYNGYYMTLFPTLLPLNKSDKMYVTILQPDMLHTFIAKFCIRKKKFNIITYVNYLKV